MSADRRIELLVEVAASVFGVTRLAIVGSSRKHRVTLARHACWRFCRAALGMSLTQIGEAFSVHHSTVLSGERSILLWASSRPEIQALLDTLWVRLDHLRVGVGDPAGALRQRLAQDLMEATASQVGRLDHALTRLIAADPGAALSRISHIASTLEAELASLRRAS